MNRLKRIAILGLMIGCSHLSGFLLTADTHDEARARKKEVLFSKYPLPKNGIPLKWVKSFPDEDQIGQDIYLKGAMGISVDDAANLIYVCDNDDHKIMVFDNQGKFIRQIGQMGQGPGSYIRPFSVKLWRDCLVVNDVGNLRIQFVDKNGKYIKSFRTFKSYMDMAINKDGIIYAIHVNKYNEPYLCDALSTDGKLLFSFGKKLDIQSDSINFMAKKIFLDPQGCIYIAHSDFAVIEKYSDKGVLIKKYQLNFPQMDNTRKLNEERTNSSTRKKGYFTCFDDFWVENGKTYCILSTPTLEIVEFNDKGEALRVFWSTEVEDYRPSHFWMGREKEKFVFYVSRILPDRGIDIFKY